MKSYYLELLCSSALLACVTILLCGMSEKGLFSYHWQSIHRKPEDNTRNRLTHVKIISGKRCGSLTVLCSGWPVSDNVRLQAKQIIINYEKASTRWYYWFVIVGRKHSCGEYKGIVTEINTSDKHIIHIYVARSRILRDLVQKIYVITTALFSLSAS